MSIGLDLLKRGSASFDTLLWEFWELRHLRMGQNWLALVELQRSR